jgi:hypothetical protein
MPCSPGGFSRPGIFKCIHRTHGKTVETGNAVFLINLFLLTMDAPGTAHAFTLPALDAGILIQADPEPGVSAGEA